MAQIDNFVRRAQHLRLFEDTSGKLIADLLFYADSVERSLRDENAKLEKELENAHLDLEDAKKSRRELQLHLNQANLQIGQISGDYDSIKNRNPYIIVLVDGDGLIFNEELVRQGIEGGKKAAGLLRDRVMENCGALANEIEIIAKVCANLTGLSYAMKRGGLLENPDDLRDFTQGFTQGKASFDFIDVGHGKERADSKIKECVRWNLRNHNCKQILLGVSHDAGYAPFLDDVMTMDDRSRITILEGPPTVRELAATNLQILNFNNIFRSEKISNRAPPPNPSPPVNSTWAGVISIPPPPASASPSLVKLSIKNTPPPPPTWTLEPRGLDQPLGVNPKVLEKVKKRNVRLCNNHYLRGPCVKDDCSFEHEYTPNDEEIKAIKSLSRMNPCQNGQDCDLEYCIYGHNCNNAQWVEKAKEWQCEAWGCRFGEEGHPPGCNVKHPRKERDYSY